MHYTDEDYARLYNVGLEENKESWLSKLFLGLAFIAFILAIVFIFLNLERTAPVPTKAAEVTPYEANPIPLSHPLPYTATVTQADANGKTRTRYYVPKEKK